MKSRLGLAVALLLALVGCAASWKLPAGVDDGTRVRVLDSSLSERWLPGRISRSSGGCWLIQVAASNDPKAIVIVAPGELSRLQVSTARPGPDWWTVPEDQEGWNELLPSVLEDASAAGCARAGVG